MAVLDFVSLKQDGNGIKVKVNVQSPIASLHISSVQKKIYTFSMSFLYTYFSIFNAFYSGKNSFAGATTNLRPGNETASLKTRFCLP